MKEEAERQQTEHNEKLQNILLQRQFLVAAEERKKEEFELKKQLLLLEIQYKKNNLHD